MKVLVTGGAGYIGSHAVKQLVAGGAEVVVLDDLSLGHEQAVVAGARLVVADIRDGEAVRRALVDSGVRAVLHFAGRSQVGESVRHPERYLSARSVNVGGSRTLLAAMVDAGVHRLVFSSSCSVYGEPEHLPIVESSSRVPVSPYGRSKVMVEAMLADLAARRPDFGAVALRYFNVAGCDADGELGEDHRPETHLIPVVLQAAAGEREDVAIFGTDYPTPDGTCVRDYVHVDDLVRAHLIALRRVQAGELWQLNLGIGRGFSVRGVIESVQRVTGIRFPVREQARRPGDPPELWADATLARRLLGWEPRWTELDAIVATAWRWKERFPLGYSG